MNKVRLLGLGLVIFGTVLGYFSSNTNFHLVSGVALGLGVAWTINGRVKKKDKNLEKYLKADRAGEQLS